MSTRYCEVGLKKLNVPGRVVLSYNYTPNRQPTIILIIDRNEKVGHFVCTWVDNRKRHFFCPYGKPASHYGLRSDFSNRVAFQDDFMHSQGGVKAINTCARHCLVRLSMRHVPHAAYRNWIGPNADVNVTIMA